MPQPNISMYGVTICHLLTKTLLKAIMHRARFSNKYLKNKTDKTKENMQNNEITVSQY